MLTEDQIKAACVSAIAKGQSLSAVMAWAFGLDRAWGSVEVKRVWLACKAKPATLKQLGARAKSITGRKVLDFEGRCISEGARCELHPATDLWMRGARFGEIVKVWAHPDTGATMITVKLDKLPTAVIVQPENVKVIS